MNLTEIVWPVFRLGLKKPMVDGNVACYITQTQNKDTAEYATSISIIDDKSIEKSTLSARRLRLAASGVKLYTIRSAIYFVADLIKLNISGTWFIDNSGRIFQYKRNKRAKLRFFKIKQILPAQGMGAIVELEGLPSRFKCLYRPLPGQLYAGVLQLGMSSMLYGFFDEKHKDTYRKV